MFLDIIMNKFNILYAIKYKYLRLVHFICICIHFYKIENQGENQTERIKSYQGL